LTRNARRVIRAALDMGQRVVAKQTSVDHG
jgi:hypothetical protein